MGCIVIGAGIAGLTCALELAARGAAVEVYERSPRLGAQACSWFAGGMLAPWCERENSEPLIAQLGAESIPWWQAHFAGTVLRGTLVVAHPRDTAELAQFARRTEQFATLSGEAIGALEPELAGRFERALYFAGEAHLDPRAALAALAERLAALEVPIRLGRTPGAAQLARAHAVLDCTGMAAAPVLPELRGVKGEMLLLHLPELALQRPVRVLHPRLPVYVVPRGGHTFMVGATLLESDDSERISARSMLELLSAAYALHPAFGEAHILEIGTAVRAAFPDNLPRLTVRGNTLFVNGLYRHGFLLGPALARRAAAVVLDGAHFPEVMDEDPRQRRLA
ncbi:MAG: FAD-dependent oxidoreductase [Proteobacteria bacterium]|nr:FAD-dependent oxidoreductase [Pseudomonadota bacterium]